MTKEVPLTQGKLALVDDEDYSRIMIYKWCAVKGRNAWYAKRRDGKNILYLHRIILDAKPGEECDHINGDGLDNRKSNLRIVTHQQNQHNQRKLNPRSSKYKGVCKRKDRRGWDAYIQVNYEQIHLGTFDSEEEAAKAYDAKAVEFYGEYARINFPLGSLPSA